jgi:hypothetical protein
MPSISSDSTPDTLALPLHFIADLSLKRRPVTVVKAYWHLRGCPQSFSSEIAMRNVDEVRAELERIPGLGPWLTDWPSFNRKVRLLAENLAEEEHIIDGVYGRFRNRMGRLVATETRLLFVEQAGLFGSVQESFAYNRISAIESTKGLFFGELTIVSGVMAQKMDQIVKSRLTPFVATVQERLAGPAGTRPPTGMATRGGNGADSISQLERLAALRDKGVLTEDEFQEKKRRLLKKF